MTARQSAAPGSAPRNAAVSSLVPARMDRLPWARFHWMVVVGLGVSWILDGIEIQLISASGYKESLGMSSAEVGLAGTIYLMGQVVGALVFGRLTDRWGRKRLFITTLAIYLIASGIAGFAWTPWFLYLWRFVAGMGIGGEYAAINSAIDELIPARHRGRVDIAINGTYWGGAMIGAVGSVFLLDHSLVPEDLGWRIAFFIGPILGLAIIYLRRFIPESPRWMVTHGMEEEAERIVDGIEASVRAQGKPLPPVDPRRAMSIIPEDSVSYAQLVDVFFRQYPSRTFLGVTMMVTQSFLYNAIFFTYALVLQNFYHLDPSQTALYFFPFAAGNLIGPLLLGPLFDTVGRRRMIFGTYVLAGTVLLASAILFRQGVLTADTHTVFWCVSFFFASAGASSAYLTVSEIFPLEVRAQAISYFFAVAQVVGSTGPLLFGWLVGEGTERDPLFWGYVLGSVVMMFGGVVALIYGVDAEGKGLEEIAEPLTKANRDRGVGEEAAETI
ncbi:MFS transporter [Azospirillum sp. INR13]|nr:MFS transporter [Azospirillum sp. INR13]MBF5096214.1 MFS transporter [Azospirillum sp. INR13]